MKQVFRMDQNGFYLEPVIIEDEKNIPVDCTEIQPPDGLYKGKFVNGEWVESLTEDEINTLKDAPQPLSDIEQLKKQQDLMQSALDDLILGGAL